MFGLGRRGLKNLGCERRIVILDAVNRDAPSPPRDHPAPNPIHCGGDARGEGATAFLFPHPSCGLRLHHGLVLTCALPTDCGEEGFTFRAPEKTQTSRHAGMTIRTTIRSPSLNALCRDESAMTLRHRSCVNNGS